MFTAKTIRVAILLMVLAAVAGKTWKDRVDTRSWKYEIHLVVYPINGDGSEVSRQYIAALTPERFGDLEPFFREQAARYGVHLRFDQAPVNVRLAPEVSELPPSPPQSGNPLSVAMWSLQLRWWAWRHGDYQTGPGQIRMFVLYHDPSRNPVLPHSLGLQKGLIGVVNAFAVPRMEAQNEVVIAHEFLHTLGAADRYDPATLMPAYPDGYADPAQQPRYPQAQAEIMGGRIPVSDTGARMPAGLRETVIGETTAREILWRDR